MAPPRSWDPGSPYFWSLVQPGLPTLVGILCHPRWMTTLPPPHGAMPCARQLSSRLPFLIVWDGDMGKSRGMLEFPPLVSVQVGLPAVRPKLDLLSVCWLTSLTRTLCSIFFTNIIPQGEGCDFLVQNMWLFENLGSGFRGLGFKSDLCYL